LSRAFPQLTLIEISTAEVPLVDAVRSYLFNSQLVSLPGQPGRMALILPAEAREISSTKACLDRLLASGGPIASAHVVNVRESMRNGGGPACLRLRVVADSAETAAIDQRFLLDEAKLSRLEAWVAETYPETLTPDMLGDAAFHRICLIALDRLTALLDLGSLYDFQR
jgi:succinylarginine dihydrolase